MVRGIVQGCHGQGYSSGLSCSRVQGCHGHVCDVFCFPAPKIFL